MRTRLEYRETLQRLKREVSDAIKEYPQHLKTFQGYLMRADGLNNTVMFGKSKREDVDILLDVLLDNFELFMKHLLFGKEKVIFT